MLVDFISACICLKRLLWDNLCLYHFPCLQYISLLWNLKVCYWAHGILSQDLILSSWTHYTSLHCITIPNSLIPSGFTLFARLHINNPPISILYCWIIRFWLHVPEEEGKHCGLPSPRLTRFCKDLKHLPYFWGEFRTWRFYHNKQMHCPDACCSESEEALDPTK